MPSDRSTGVICDQRIALNGFLDPQAAAKIVTAKLRLELGNTSSVKWFDGIGEYIIDWGPGYRVYLARDGDTLTILFGGCTKRGQQKDIDKAKALHHEYKVRKKAKAACQVRTVLISRLRGAGSTPAVSQFSVLNSPRKAQKSACVLALRVFLLSSEPETIFRPTLQFIL